MKLKILNKNKEKLDTLLVGKQNSNITLILVHGFGVDKHETAGYFDSISQELGKDYRIIRFDFSGYGKSEGKQEEWDYQKGATDLQAIIDWVKKEYKGEIYILAHSMGTFVTALLSPGNIKKIALTGIPNSNTNFIINRLSKRLISRSGAVLNKKSISIFPRTSGQTTRIGSTFWLILEKFDPIKAFKQLNKKTKLMVIHPLQDDVVGNEYMKEYKLINNLNYIEIDGDHSFKKAEDRINLISIIKEFFKK